MGYSRTFSLIIGILLLFSVVVEPSTAAPGLNSHLSGNPAVGGTSTEQGKVNRPAPTPTSTPSNVLLNPGFERADPGDPTKAMKWTNTTGGRGGIVTRQSTIVHSGTAAVDLNSPSDGYGASIQSDLFRLTGHLQTPLVVRWWVYSNIPSAAIGVRFWRYDENQQYIDVVGDGSIPLAANTWTKLEVPIEPRPDARFGSVDLVNFSGPAGLHLYVDDVEVEFRGGPVLEVGHSKPGTISSASEGIGGIWRKQQTRYR